MWVNAREPFKLIIKRLLIIIKLEKFFHGINFNQQIDEKLFQIGPKIEM